MPAPTEITPMQLSRLIGRPDCPAIIDVRIAEDIAASPGCIPGAIHVDHSGIETVLPHIGTRRAVVICHQGKKLSMGAAALLRVAGIDAVSLHGGHVAWVDAGLPVLNTGALPATRPTRWVTRHRPKIDRLACPWLIRRFVDDGARFLYVPPAEVAAVADRFDAQAFDIDGAFWSHREEMCSFQVMVCELGLRDMRPLAHMGRIINAADTGRPDAEPQAAGLLAISLGLSRMYRDDLAQLDAALPVYDALYRWCRDATDETHDWAGERGRSGA